MKIDDVYKALCARHTISAKDIDWVYSMIYEIYYQGIQEGKQQIKDEIHNKLDKFLEED